MINPSDPKETFDRLYREFSSHVETLRTDSAWPPDGGIVWHYTSLETALKIIKPGNGQPTLQLSPFSKMTDGKEGLWLSSNIGTRLPDTHLLQGILGRRASDPFATCFCKTPDLLSQWSMYGDSGQGLALGFRADQLRQQAVDHLPIPEFIDLIYKDDADTFFERAAELAKQFTNAMLKLPPEASGNQRGFWKYMSDLVSKHEPYIKNGRFNQEDERRIIVRHAEPTDYRLRRDDLIPYVELSLGRDILAEVMIGPLCNANPADVHKVASHWNSKVAWPTRSKATLVRR